jgi:hypothetical protein
VLSVAQPSKKALMPTIGHQMANFTVWPVANLSIDNFYQRQLMKKFIKALEILMPANHSFIFNSAWYPRLFYFWSPNDDLFVLQTFINLILLLNDFYHT